MSSSSTPGAATEETKEQPNVFHRQLNDRINACSGGGPLRFEFWYEGQPIYVWEQTIDEVILSISNVPSSAPLQVQIEPSHVRIGLNGATSWFVDEDTYGKVDVKESTWTKDDTQTLTVYLQKANKGVVWECALTRHNCLLDPFQLEQVKQELLRERWARENPGMDFSSAVFNGQAPDPRSFMGGCSYDA